MVKRKRLLVVLATVLAVAGVPAGSLTVGSSAAPLSPALPSTASAGLLRFPRPLSSTVGVLTGDHVTAVDRGRPSVGSTGAHQESEGYDLTLNMIDRNGAVITPDSGNGVAMVQNLDDQDEQYFPVRSGEKLRLPAGRYAVLSYLNTEVPGRVEPSVTAGVQPEIRLTGDKVVTVDAREGRRTDLRLDAKDAQVVSGTTGLLLRTDKISAGFINELGREQYAIPTPGSSSGFLYYTRAQLERAAVRLSVRTPEAFEVPVKWAPGAADFVGTKSLETVDVGHAGPDEIAGRELTGKLAVFTLSGGKEFLRARQAVERGRRGCCAVLPLRTGRHRRGEGEHPRGLRR